MRFTLTAHWASGYNVHDEYSLHDIRAELISLADVLDCMAPGDTFTFKRIADAGPAPDWAGRGFTRSYVEPSGE